MSFSEAGNLTYGASVCLHGQNMAGYDGQGIPVTDSTQTYDVQGCVSWITLGKALNGYGVASLSDVSAAVNPSAITAQVNAAMAGYATTAQLNSLAGQIGVGVPDFNPVTAGEFFGFAFCGVLLCWLTAHLASMVLRPLRR